MNKVCKNCGKEYPLSEEYFPRRKHPRGGEMIWLPRCKSCQRDYNTEMKRRQRKRDLEKGLNCEFK